MRFPFIKSRLRKAIERGLANGNLNSELLELDDLVLKSSGDGADVIWGLEQIHDGTSNLSQNAYALAGLFQKVDEETGENAFFELKEHGTPELLRLYDLIDQSSGEDSSKLMFLLKILAMYGTTAGAAKIVEAAQRPLEPDGYMWTSIFFPFQKAHPERDFLFESLSNPLPGGFMAISLLDAANNAAREDADFKHPYDSPHGKEKLRTLLLGGVIEEFSYAHSATAALPFIHGPEQEELLQLAMQHRDVGVRMESAWAMAKTGKEDGISALAKLCLDWKTAETAKRYLTELGREDSIPDTSQEPTFQALSNFSLWLSHPNELARFPDELEVVDHRQLRWPPERELKPFWLIKYTAYDESGLEDDNVGCGLVGSMTFCFFSYRIAERPPEDGYAIHCYWEMEQAGLIEDSEVGRSRDEYAHMLDEWNGPSLENARVVYVTELSPELSYPQRLVALAAATMNGEEGWAALDGPRSQWYLASEQPEKSSAHSVLRAHVGRQLLGLTEPADRKKYLFRPKPPRPPEQVIRAYEKLLSDALAADDEKQKRDLGGYGPIGNHFEAYVLALKATGHEQDARSIFDEMAPRWDHATGYSRLGGAAFRAGYVDLAERFLTKYREGGRYFERGEDMIQLAELWRTAGKLDQAKELLVECMQRLLKDSAEESDSESFEEWFQQHRSAMLRLFPENGANIMKDRDIPESTLVN